MKKLVLVLLLSQQRCSFLPTPQGIRQQVEDGLVPYFPHVTTVLTPNSVVLGVTCADLGLEAIREFPAVLDRNAQVQKMKQFGGLAGVRGFGLGFPDYVLILDLATKQYQINPADAGYRAQYAILCNQIVPRNQ